MIVESNEDILYVKKIVQNLYNYINSPKEDIGAKLLDILSFKIKTLSEDIITHKTISIKMVFLILHILFKNYIMLVKEVRRYYEKTTSDIGVSIH